MDSANTMDVNIEQVAADSSGRTFSSTEPLDSLNPILRSAHVASTVTKLVIWKNVSLHGYL